MSMATISHFSSHTIQTSSDIPWLQLVGVAIPETAPVLECTGRAANLYAVLQGATLTLPFFMVCMSTEELEQLIKTHSA